MVDSDLVAKVVAEEYLRERGGVGPGGELRPDLVLRRALRDSVDRAYLLQCWIVEKQGGKREVCLEQPLVVDVDRRGIVFYGPAGMEYVLRVELPSSLDFYHKFWSYVYGEAYWWVRGHGGAGASVEDVVRAVKDNAYKDLDWWFKGAVKDALLSIEHCDLTEDGYYDCEISEDIVGGVLHGVGEVAVTSTVRAVFKYM